MTSKAGELKASSRLPLLLGTPGFGWRIRWPRGPLAFSVVLAVIALALHGTASLTWHQNVTVVGGCKPASNLSQTDISAHGFAVTHCGDDGTRHSELTASFPSGTKRIVLEILNYGAANAKSMALVNRTGVTKPLVLPGTSSSPTYETVLVPHSIRQVPFDLVLRDGSSSLNSWVGLSIDGYSSLYANLDALAVATLIVLLLHLVLVELGAIALRLRAGNWAANVAMLELGVISFAAFWVYYASRVAGITFSIVILMTLIAHTTWRAIGTRHRTPSQELHNLQGSFAPVATLALLLLIVGFYPFPEHWSFWQYIANRWQSLPIDNWLPKIFADQIWNGHVDHPMVGNWLSSDRPPLQTGFYLLLRPLAPADAGTLYQVAAVYLQASILVPLASIVGTLRLDRVRGLALLVISTSALVIYNGTFVWPKLIAATYCLIAYVALFSWTVGTRKGLAAISCAAIAAALAMLSHGGAIFALISIFAVYCARGGWQHWRELIPAAVLAAIVYVPWMIYQHFIDPPGTRLISWMLAGQIAPTSTPVTKVLYEAYAHLTLSQWWYGRLANVATVCHGILVFFKSVASVFSEPSAFRRLTLVNSFFYFFFAQWFFSPLIAIASAILGWKKLREQRRDILTLTTTICCGLAIWCALMYNADSTVIHQGAYFLNITSFILCICCVCLFNRYIFSIISIANIALFIWIFALSQRTLIGQNPPLPDYISNANWLPTSSALYTLMIAVALLFHYFTCRNLRSERADAQMQW